MVTISVRVQDTTGLELALAGHGHVTFFDFDARMHCFCLPKDDDSFVSSLPPPSLFEYCVCVGLVHFFLLALNNSADQNKMDNCSPVVVLEEKPQCARTCSIATVSTVQNTDDWTTGSDSNATSSDLYMSATDKLFPYHIVVNYDFTITKVGKQLPRILEILKEELIGQKIDNVLTITQPRGAQWKWGWLILQNDQSFRVEPSIGMPSLKEIRFKASAVHIDEGSCEAMINIVPDATSMDDLLEMNLTLDDVPLHSGHRDALHMGEKLKNQEMQRTEVKKDEIRQVQLALTKERQLLESLVPKHVAEGLRKGENVKPRLHKDVTFFFSDVVGFTDICKQLYPWQVVGLLNRLYCVMDYLADRFNLFKVR